MAIGSDRLPINVEKGAVGGPRFNVKKQIAMSGKMQRVQLWDHPLGQWDISYPLRERTNLDSVQAFFFSHGGSEIPFRFRAWDNYQAVDQLIGSGDGVTDSFQLVKIFTVGSNSYSKPIQLPEPGSVVITADGVAQIENTDYAVNYQTGAVTFINVPTYGDIVASFNFDHAVIFEDDQFKAAMDSADKGRVPRVTITEVLGE